MVVRPLLSISVTDGHEYWKDFRGYHKEISSSEPTVIPFGWTSPCLTIHEVSDALVVCSAPSLPSTFERY